MRIRSLVSAGMVALAMATVGIAVSGSGQSAFAYDGSCLTTNNGNLCQTVRKWTCIRWASTGASFGWSGVGTIGACAEYIETTTYYYNEGTVSGGDGKPLF